MLEASLCIVTLFFLFAPATSIPACTGPPTKVGEPCELKLPYIVRNKEEARAVCTRHWPRSVVHFTFDANGTYCHYETTFECKDKDSHLIYDTCYTALPGKMSYNDASGKCSQQAGDLPIFYGKQQLKFVTLLAARLNLSTIWTGVKSGNPTKYIRFNENFERSEPIRKVEEGQLVREENKNLVILRARSVNDEGLPRGYLEKVDYLFMGGALCAKAAIPAKTFEPWCKMVNEHLRIPTAYVDPTCLMLTSNTYVANYDTARSLHRKCNTFDQISSGYAAEVDKNNTQVVRKMLKERKSSVRLAGRRRVRPDASVKCCEAAKVTEKESCGDDDFRYSQLDGQFYTETTLGTRVIHSLCTDFPELPSTLALSDGDLFFDPPAFSRFPVLCAFGPEKSTSRLVEEGNCKWENAKIGCPLGFKCSTDELVHTVEVQNYERINILKCARGTPLELSDPLHVDTSAINLKKNDGKFVCDKNGKWTSTLNSKQTMPEKLIVNCVVEYCGLSCCSTPITRNSDLHAKFSCGSYASINYYLSTSTAVLSNTLPQKLSCPLNNFLEFCSWLEDLTGRWWLDRRHTSYVCGYDGYWMFDLTLNISHRIHEDPVSRNCFYPEAL